MRADSLNFDVDLYINRIIPPSPIHLLPKPVSWMLGYRSTPPRLIGSVLVWWWAFIGAFVGILIVEAVFNTETLQARGTPIIIASMVRCPSLLPTSLLSSTSHHMCKGVLTCAMSGCLSSPRIQHNRLPTGPTA
jgi:hypothetical protein